jgi:hypothetical protein
MLIFSWFCLGFILSLFVILMEMLARADVGEKAREAEGKCDANEGAALLGSAREVGVSKEEKAFAGTCSSPPPFTVLSHFCGKK